jgi:hypothetical protein
LCPYLLLFFLNSFLLDPLLRFLQLQNPVIRIRLIHNRIPLENTAGAPAADFHNHPFSNSRPAKIPCSSSPQIVKEQIRYSRISASAIPHPTKINHWLSVGTSENEVIALLAMYETGEQLVNPVGHEHIPAVFVLRRTWLKPNHAPFGVVQATTRMAEEYSVWD